MGIPAGRGADIVPVFFRDIVQVFFLDIIPMFSRDIVPAFFWEAIPSHHHVVARAGCSLQLEAIS
jgi:hypothetical protein